jgi:outer membrane immunogenic protein
MTRPLIALLPIVALGAAPALAQDLPVANWAGPSLGAQLGYGFANTSSVTTNLVQTFPVPFDYGSNDVLGGVHAGYNFQFGHFVFGAEGDVEASAISGQQPVNLYGVIYTSQTTNDFDASVRARAGVAFDRLLLYGTGGVAWGRVKIAYSCNLCVAAAAATSTLDDVRMGWTVGVGAEYSLTRNVSLNFEYRYTDFGYERLIDTFEVADYHDNHVTLNALRLGMSYHFLP